MICQRGISTFRKKSRLIERLKLVVEVFKFLPLRRGQLIFWKDFLASRGQILRAENLDTFSDVESTADGNKIRIPARLLALDELGYTKVLVSPDNRLASEDNLLLAGQTRRDHRHTRSRGNTGDAAD